MKKSKIEWTDTTWNPITGCTKVSEGCKNCYAERMANRLKLMGQAKYRNGFEVTIHDDTFEDPYHWRKPRMVFVNSMSDLFHKDIDPIIISKLFNVMNASPKHTFQILTKRPKRLLELNSILSFSRNIWMGISIELQRYEQRIRQLIKTHAQTKFLSCEPLLGPLQLEDYLSKLDWIIVGGESGPHARPIKKEWVLDIKDQCQDSGTPFFFKQWGGVNKHKTGRLLDGQEYNEFPKISVKQRRNKIK